VRDPKALKNKIKLSYAHFCKLGFLSCVPKIAKFIVSTPRTQKEKKEKEEVFVQ
jgi:hypothetical protein